MPKQTNVKTKKVVLTSFLKHHHPVHRFFPESRKAIKKEFRKIKSKNGHLYTKKLHRKWLEYHQIQGI